MRHATFLLPAGVAIALAATAAHADPPRTPAVTCNGGGLTARPTFNQVSPGRAEYHFSGVCTTREGRFLGYRLDATWTPSETNPANANASEIYRIDSLSGPSQSYVVILGARCERDPWLNDASCTRVGDNMPDELRELWPELGSSLFPYSRRGIPYDQRDALRAEYAHVNGSFDRSQLVTERVRSDDNNKFGAATARKSHSVYRPGEAVTLNPQPLPPRDRGSDQASELSMVELQSVVSKRATTQVLTENMTSGINQSEHAVANNIGDRNAGATADRSVYAQRDDAASNAYQRSDRLQNQVRQGPSYQELSQPENTIRIEVRYPTAYGYKNATGLFDPAPNSCDAFSVNAGPAAAGRDNRQRQPIQIATQPRMRNSNGVYVCGYLISSLPLDQPMNVYVNVGTPRQPSTEAWMGGNQAQPTQGQHRVIADDTRTVTLTANQPRASLTFNMIYSGGPSEFDPVR